MRKYSIGIDTGGTYTDAVVIDQSEKTVIATAKALTTKGDLSVGIGEALVAVLNGSPIKEQNYATVFSHLSLSTTLCTNALVEGHGSSITVFLIGFSQAMVERTQISHAIPTAKIVHINGGHNYSGAPLQALDKQAILQALQTEAGNSEAFAVASHYSVRNPEHERRAQALIATQTGKPVTLSSELSAALDAPRRALTACFNAKIIALIVALEASVMKIMSKLSLQAPVMIVKGDGSVTKIEIVTRKPIETILSGPAASVIGARFLTRQQDFVIADIGGTTTDVATVVNGWPKLNVAGSSIGGFRTLVKAIDMKTIGLGGDSEVDLNEQNKVVLRNNRVMPMAMLVHRWPQLERELELALSANSGMRTAIMYVCLPLGINHDDDITQTVSQLSLPADLSDSDRSFLSKIPLDKPIHYSKVATGAADRLRIRRLTARGLIQVSGLTPSDAAHVLGQQSQWSSRGAGLAAELFGRAAGYVSGSRLTQKQQVHQQIQSLARQIVSTVVTNSSHILVEELAGRCFDRSDPLLTAAIHAPSDDIAERQSHQLGYLKVALSPKIPIIAVGGPAPVFYPEVGRRLLCETLIPDNSSVANAIGAAVAEVKIISSVEITRDQKNGFRLHGKGDPIIYSSATEVINAAKLQARSYALTSAYENMHRSIDFDTFANETDSHIWVDLVNIPGVEGDEALVSATVSAEVVISEAINNLV